MTTQAKTLVNTGQTHQTERSGYEFEPVRLFNSLGTIRVEFFDPSGQQMSLPISCTTLAGEDPYIHFSDSQGFFRVPDLLEVSAILSWIKQQMEATCSKGTGRVRVR